MTKIASPLDEIKEHYDVVVIGSGYGGGIAASRLARAGRKVCLLERGREIEPGEYPDTPERAKAEFQVHAHGRHIGSDTGLFDLHVNAQQNVLVGCGLGGTSLINANVALEATPAVFADPRWPAGIDDEHLKQGYDLARRMLGSTPYPANGARLPKQVAHRMSAESMGQSANFYLPPINVTFAPLPNNTNHVGVQQLPCNNCGDCVSGCNHRAKNTTLMNYLPDAHNHGAEIYCCAAVSHVARHGDGWMVYYQEAGAGRDKFDAPPLFVKADIVVVSAGTLGSTEIMLRSRAKGLPLSAQLGRNFSGNGDILGFGYNGDQPVNGIGFGRMPAAGSAPTGPVGPCITSIIDMRKEQQRERRMVIEEGSIPGALGRLMISGLATAAAVLGHDSENGVIDEAMEKVREGETALRGPYYGALHHTQTYLVMSHDDASGTMTLDGHDQLRIDWPAVGSGANFRNGDANLRQASAALGATYVRNPIWTGLFEHSVISVHPLGGCAMGEDARRGVVNHKGQVYSGQEGGDVHPGLYITDGSVIPTSLAVNPLLTISAISERAMRLLADDRGWSIDYTLPSAPRARAASGTLGIAFTERMTGHISTAFTDALGTNLPAYEPARQRGAADGSAISFTLTISSNDMEKLIGDPSYPAAMTGTVSAPALSPAPLAASKGEFHLFEPHPGQVDVRHMRYNMRLVAEDGAQYYFSAFKSIPSDHNALNIWHDTSTLYVTLHKGPDRSQPVFAAGVMHIRPQDFAVQMTTMKVSNAPDEKARLAALARFGKYFAGVLWDSYGGVLAGGGYFDPGAPPRQRRQLNAGAPEVSYFKTEDGVELRLTRHQGGGKGPVMLVHGAGVASSIFSTDTIPTNLLEYLYSHGYDVWLLDFRVSIDLPASARDSDGDQVARYDFPAAIKHIQQATGAADVQCLVHCYGATTFFMSLLAGLQGVRSVVCSQIAADLVVPDATRIKTGLHLPSVLEKLGIDSLTAYTDTESDWFNKLYDKALGAYAHGEAQGRCDSPTCHRITFMYASLYKHDTLNDALHDNLHELFGQVNIRTLVHLARMCREGKLVGADGEDFYMPNMERLRLPICFISGAENECYLPASTQKTYDRLCGAFGQDNYTRHVVPGYGHIDCIFGKHAVNDVYPLILAHLEKTALANQG